MIRSLFGAMVAAILATAGSALPAQAADDSFCKDYAQVAAKQFLAAEKHERCEAYLREAPDRWNNNYKHHYEWCRGVNRDAAWAERNHRKHDLEKCTHR